MRVWVLVALALLLGPATGLCRPAKSAAAPTKRTRVAKPAKPAKVGKAKARVRPAILFTHLSTHESLRLRPEKNGRFGTRQLRSLRHLLRCHHTGRKHAISGRLVSLLYATARHFGGRDVEIIAGYRAPKIARAKGVPRSHHKAGQACDFRLRGVSAAALRDYLRRTYSHIGVGYYPSSGFVHLDVRKEKSAFWIDYSGPGERASYSENANDDVRSGRADAPSPRAAPPAEDDGHEDEPLDDPGLDGERVGRSDRAPLAAP